MRYESLILDIDGTLWDSRALVAQGYNLQLTAEGLSRYFVDAERLKPLFGKVMTEIADAMFPDLPEDSRYALMERCMERENRFLHENECAIGYPGVAEALSCLAERHRLFIVSNSQCGYPELCMDKLGIQQLIGGHLCFGDTGTPKGETIRVLMERHDITSAVYIGDTQGDADAARDAGIPFVWASYGFGTPTGWITKADTPADLTDIFR